MQLVCISRPGLYHFQSINQLAGQNHTSDDSESLWDNLSFFKLIYGQKLFGRPGIQREKLEEHQELSRMPPKQLGLRNGSVIYWLRI